MSRIGHNYLWPKRPEAAINLILRIEKRKKKKNITNTFFIIPKTSDIISFYVLNLDWMSKTC